MMKRAIILATTATLALSWTACGDDETEAPASVTAITYNLGLAVGFVPAAVERATTTIDATAALDADVICVQEVWLPEHITELQAAAAASHPNSVFMAPDAGTVGAAACLPADTMELLACVSAAGCYDVCTDEVVDCVLLNCGAEFGALPPDCNGCLQANVGKPLAEIESSCQSESTEYAFGGSFGTGLLSKYPIIAQETKVLDSTTNRRGVLYAELDTPFGPVHTFCTHLTAVFSSIPWPKATGSWQEEQAAQIAELVAMVEEKAGADGQVMVMGDFNTGPAGAAYDAEVAANYDLFTAAGLASPYADSADATCTFCGANPLIGGDEKVVIDHVFTRSFAGTPTSRRVLDGSLEVTSCGEPLSAAYSDHYGVSVSITR